MNNQEYRIFVVDDDEMMRELITERLSLLGYTVESASSGKEAIRKLKESSYHLFIIDIKMPDMSGVELLEKLDVKNNSYGAIIITGYGDVDSARRAMELGAYSYLVKPFDNKDLMNQVNKALKMVALKKERMEYIKITESEFGKSSKELQDLIDIIHFTEEVSTKIHGVLDKDKIYRIIKKESDKSKRYSTSIVMLTDDKSKLTFVEASVSPDEVKLGEKLTRLKLGEYKIYLNKSSIYRRVIKEGKSFQIEVCEVIGELLPKPLSCLVSNTLELENKFSILTPLKRRGKIIGAFTISSTKLSEHFIQSVKNLAQHISIALELADEYAEHKRIEKILQEREAYSCDLLHGASAGILIVDTHSHEIIDVNLTAAKMIGLPKDQIIGHSCHHYICSDTNGRCPISDFGQDIDQRECLLLTVKGTEVPIIKTVVPSILNGRVCFIETFIDITKRKKAENELTNSQKQLRDLAAHLQSVREEERTMVAREIHDELGQVLTALKMDLSWLTNKLPHDQGSLLKKTKSMNQLIDSTIETVKRISTELRPGLLDDMGLVAAIEWQTEEFRNRTGIDCKITADLKEEYLDEYCKTTIFRILQEALTNVVRHAGATKVKVSVLEKDGELKLKVSDNGKGIKEEQVSHCESLGLIGISERARSQGGSVEFQGVRGKGTTMTVNIPLNKETVGSRQ